MQAAVEGAEASAPLFERRQTGSGTLEGYSQGAYPRAGEGAVTPLSVRYYDDYAFPNASAYPFQVLTGFDAQHIGGQKPGQLKGKQTGGKTRLMGSAEWLQSVVYYDDYNRPLQTITENHSQGGGQRGRDVVTSRYAGPPSRTTPSRWPISSTSSSTRTTSR